ncbi:regulation of nuclear pre-mRNA domain-containing protein 1A [Rhypophila decipiens]
MAYTNDAVLSKLSALNESHESIASTAQWIMFHRRHAATSVQLWLAKLKELPSSKKLNMIYLANEVTQQSKARHKEDFLQAFSPYIAEATTLAYTGANADIQNKLRRVVDVWRDRNIFDRQIQDAMESKLDEIDKARSTNKVGAFGGSRSMFASSASLTPSLPAELTPLVAPAQNLSKSTPNMKTAINTANTEFDKLVDPANPPPAPPVQAARLSGLLKTLAMAENLVSESMKNRKELVSALEKILATNKEALATEEVHFNELTTRKAVIEAKKQEVELAILGGNNSIKEQTPGDRMSCSPVPEPERPQVEALTPPHVQNHHEDDIYGDLGNPQNGNDANAAPPPVFQQERQFPSATSGIEILSDLASHYQTMPLNGSSKKRKLGTSNDEGFPDLGADDGIDADVAEMLRKDSQSS